MNYTAPDFIPPEIDYQNWLGKKAESILRRDKRNKCSEIAPINHYIEAIHKAVVKCNGVDDYTGEDLDWNLLSSYNNEESQAGGIKHMMTFALLPTIDHADGLCNLNFRICAWRTNDAKSYFSLDEFKTLCQRVVDYDAK